jgi:hypothetical protein
MGRFAGRPPWLKKTAEGGDTAVAENSSHFDESPEEIDEFVDLFAVLSAVSEEVELDNSPVEPNVQSGPPDLVTPEQRVAYGLARPPRFGLTLRSYQQESIESWVRHEGPGLIVLPTRAGKTVVALAIAARI